MYVCMYLSKGKKNKYCIAISIHLTASALIVHAYMCTSCVYALQNGITNSLEYATLIIVWLTYRGSSCPALQNKGNISNACIFRCIFLIVHPWLFCSWRATRYYYWDFMHDLRSIILCLHAHIYTHLYNIHMRACLCNHSYIAPTHIHIYYVYIICVSHMAKLVAYIIYCSLLPLHTHNT